MVIQIHSTGKAINSSVNDNNPLQRKVKPKPKCNFNDFKNCYVLRNGNKTWHDSGKQCKQFGK